jgi:hypothetical protein
MSKWKNKDGKTVRRNQIATQFAWQAIDMLESPAFRVLSLSARRVIDRIQIEHAHHGGKENGKLPVTFRDFKEYGIHWNSIAPAIREAVALGFIRVTQEGIASNKEFRIPNMFALTHLPTDKDPKPAEDWKRIKTVEEAAVIAAASRKAPARFSRFQRKKKSGLRYGNRIEPQYGNRIEGEKISIRKAYHCQLQKPYHFLYLGRVTTDLESARQSCASRTPRKWRWRHECLEKCSRVYSRPVQDARSADRLPNSPPTTNDPFHASMPGRVERAPCIRNSSRRSRS